MCLGVNIEIHNRKGRKDLMTWFPFVHFVVKKSYLIFQLLNTQMFSLKIYSFMFMFCSLKSFLESLINFFIR